MVEEQSTIESPAMKRAAFLALALITLAATLVAAPAVDPAKIAPDIEARLARFKKVEMPFTYEGMSARERHLVDEMIAACRDLEDIYWRQNNPDDIALYNATAHASDPGVQALHHYLWINGSRFDQINENQPFYGTEPDPPGRSLFPKGITRDEIEAYVKAHPSEKKGIYDERTVVELVSRNPLKLRTVPYHVKYKTQLTRAAAHLRAAAGLSDDRAFARYLRNRATALLTDDYYPSDLEWVALKDPKFDLIFAPYETYLDDLLGIKTSYGASVLVRNEAESQKLAVFQKYVPDIQDALPLPAEDRPSKKGLASPMEVMDAPFRAGDLRHGYQAAADNLPNDPRIHEKVGSKKIFFKNFTDGRVNEVILPVAKLVMRPDQAALASGEGYLAGVMMHELAHGLGPAMSRRNGQRVDIREAIGPTFSGLEEAKADVTGMWGLSWLIDRGALPRERLQEYYASYVAGIFRTVRFGTAEAHGRAEMMEFNYLSEHGAISRGRDGRYAVSFDKMPDAIAALAKELLEIEATGDRARAEAWFAKYDQMPAELRTALDAAKNVPVDVDPLVPFREGVK
jgi:hypothetical protein